MASLASFYFFAIQTMLCALPQCTESVETATPLGQCCQQCGESDQLAVIVATFCYAIYT